MCIVILEFLVYTRFNIKELLLAIHGIAVRGGISHGEGRKMSWIDVRMAGVRGGPIVRTPRYKTDRLTETQTNNDFIICPMPFNTQDR